MLVMHAVSAEVIFFDDSGDHSMVAPSSSRWVPGHDGGSCSSATALPGALCGPGSGSDESVWGTLSAPWAGAIVDTNTADYGSLTPIPFNDFLWVSEEPGDSSGVFSDYLYSEFVSYSSGIYLQFNSAFPAGFGCLVTCPHTIAENGITTAGYIRWSDGTNSSFDQITFLSVGQIPEPSSLLLLAAGFIPLFWRFRKARPRFG